MTAGEFLINVSIILTVMAIGALLECAVQLNNGHALVTVTDEGRGISAEHRDRIFDRFYRVDEGRSRESDGTGLGLAIAKWAVEANDGRITLESPGRGSTFRINLPLVSHTEGVSR